MTFSSGAPPRRGKPFVPFDIEEDYRRYVDGKPRYDGVKDFLRSRGIELPFAAPEANPEAPSVQALGKLKDRYFWEHLEEHGVEVYEPAVSLVRTLRAQEIRTAVVLVQQKLRCGAGGGRYRATLRRAGGRK